MRLRLGTLLACFALALALPVMAAPGDVPPDSARLHVYVHYDYMVEADGTSYAPDPEAIERVQRAFAGQGIDLHVDPQHTAIPARQLVFMESTVNTRCVAPDEVVPFEQLKSQYFHPNSNHPWRYAIFAVRHNCEGNVGFAEINGDDFVVSLGQHIRELRGLPREDMLRYVGATFMHELGHTLGLHHGGAEDTNFKPNYLSVMNYIFSFVGIPFATTLGSVEIAGFRLDYSRHDVPALDEGNLDETVGIQAGTKDITAFVNESGGGLGPATGPIDWNLDGDPTQRHVAINLTIFSDGFLTLLPGFDDWSYLKAVLRGTLPRGPRSLPVYDRAHLPQIVALEPAGGTALGGTEVTIHGMHLGKVDTVLFGNVPAVSFRIEGGKTVVAIAPPGSGTVHVRVAAEGNWSPPSAAALYSYLRPLVREVIPASGIPGTVLTLTGARLATTRGIVFARPIPGAGQGFPPLSFEVVDDNTVTVRTPFCCSSEIVTSVLVTTDLYGTNELLFNFHMLEAWRNLFTFTTDPRPAPVITSVTPSSGPPGSQVEIVGTGFRYMLGGSEQNGAIVAFGDTAAVGGQFLADRIVTVTPPGTGTVDVRVFTFVGKSATGPQARFTYTAP